MNYFILFAQKIPYFMQVFYAIAYFTGSMLVVRGVLNFKLFGTSRSMMTPNVKFSTPFLFIFCGVLLLNLKNVTMLFLLDAIFGNPLLDDLAYTSIGTFGSVIYAAKNIIRLIGYISIFRGILQLSAASEQSRHPIGKSLTHIVAGAMAVNVNTTLLLLHNIIN